MPTGWSMSVLRQTASHLRTQTRPQIAGSGFASRMRSIASRYSPIADKARYPWMSTCPGQPSVQGETQSA